MKHTADKNWSLQVRGGGAFCELCGQTGFRIDAHHYIHRSQCSKLRHEIRNGCRICITCHTRAHLDPKWFANEFQRIRPADKKYCDDVYKSDNQIKETND